MGRWKEYYQNLTASDFIGNLFGQREFLEEIIRLAPGKSLEVGAGSGSLSIFLSYLGFSVVASDKEPEIIEVIRENNRRFGGKVREVILADSFRLPYPQDSFDLVFHQGVLEHFADAEIRQMLLEQLRVAPQVLFSVPNQNYPRRDLGDERLLSGLAWRSILRPFPIVWQKDYSPKIFPRWSRPKACVQHMILIERPSPAR